MTKKTQLSTKHKHETFEGIIIDENYANKKRNTTFKREDEALEGTNNEKTDNSDPFVVFDKLESNEEVDSS